MFSFRTTTLSLGLVKSRSSFHQGPLRWNGHWFSYVYIKALSNGMVIDFLMFTSRPSPMEWSLIFLYQGPLRWNGHWFSYLYIKTLSDGMVINFLMFTSRPSPMEWSLIFLCLQQDPLQWNGHCFLSLHQDPLRWNGHWFSYVYIKVLSNGMVIDFLMFTARPSPMEWSLFSFHIMTLFTELVIAPVWVGFCSSSSSLKFRQNWCLYLYLSFTVIIWKCHIFILSNKI